MCECGFCVPHGRFDVIRINFHDCEAGSHDGISVSEYTQTENRRSLGWNSTTAFPSLICGARSSPQHLLAVGGPVRRLHIHAVFHGIRKYIGVIKTRGACAGSPIKGVSAWFRIVKFTSSRNFSLKCKLSKLRNTDSPISEILGRLTRKNPEVSEADPNELVPINYVFAVTQQSWRCVLFIWKSFVVLWSYFIRIDKSWVGTKNRLKPSHISC